MIYLDTHVVVWLYSKELSRFTDAGLQAMETNDLFISPMVVLELEYLCETGKTSSRAHVLCGGLQDTIGLRTCDRSFGAVTRIALNQEWTRDPFDRIIVAQARLADAPLLTKDEVIRRHYKKAFWD